ncbi:glycosyltransferase family 90 protein [Xylariomycetidae sp. FL0641]|nr:glycosyltransferase family 90 protein [Xylariomycetidae sp. FL0641]
MRPRQLLTVGAALFILICLASLFRLGPSATNLADLESSYESHGSHDDGVNRNPEPVAPVAPVAPVDHFEHLEPFEASLPSSPPSSPLDPKPIPAPAGSHPIAYLVTQAEKELEATKARQSKTLEQAVAEYRRRYGIPPPPNFNKWFEFAKGKNVQLIDEFDIIHESMTPFWGLRPATIRARAAEALGFDNALLGISIRNGKITHIQGGGEWQREATAGMMGKFLKWLPDMDLCFNLHDESRVVVPHDDLSRLVQRAKDVNMPAANAHPNPKNEFTQKPKGLNDGTRFEESKLTRFNVFAHQPTWTHSRVSCPPESPARGLEENEKKDDISKYAMGDLGFTYNVTAMMDICQSPSLSSTFGFFDRPNAYNIVHDLFPIFSQSKISSYSDILYPSPWYWYEKVSYDESKDYAWDAKYDSFYWRGSTTGGFSRNGGWRRQHRQRFVQKINAADSAKILVQTDSESGRKWETKLVPRGDLKDLIDINFSGIGQCDPGDCDAQHEFFEVKSHAEQQDAWKYKYLLDIDGNAFSGRFYAFLKSRSLIYKWAIFKEWHLEWLKPWAHYLPLSIQGDEWLEMVRYFAKDEAGTKEAERLAIQQREWANKALRHEDMEVWFFRLLLEYGRVVDDDRATIGYSPGSQTAATQPLRAEREGAMADRA